MHIFVSYSTLRREREWGFTFQMVFVRESPTREEGENLSIEESGGGYIIST